MINSKRLATVLLTLGLGLSSLPATGWAAPISLDSGAYVSDTATFALVWSPAPSGDFSLMLLDSFASVADSLTYYQDAAASEAYLGTACDPPC
jgi:hypothetical protein